VAEPRRLPLVYVDVFARRPLEGNPLAVVTDARALSDAEMQAIARETRLSETTFVLPRPKELEARDGIRVRIFTVGEELRFAGHPTVGTAWVLHEAGAPSPVVLDLKGGRVPVEFTDRGGQRFGEMRQIDPTWGQTHDRSRVAAALGIDDTELAPEPPIQTVSTGNPFVLVLFRSLETLRELKPDPARMREYLAGADARFFYLVSRETEDPDARLHARMIFYGGEDPATGSAAGPAGAWLVRHGLVAPEERFWIEQGNEIARPSQIFVRVGGSPPDPRDVRVGGFCFGLIRAELTLT
jgi:trans-2,3-dihydro-3-hydroxyanthranilate isomerase